MFRAMESISGWVLVVVFVAQAASAFQTRSNLCNNHPSQHDPAASKSTVLSVSSSSYTNNDFYVSLSEDAYRDVATMEDWATACGIQRAEGIAFAPSQEGNLVDYGGNANVAPDVGVWTQTELWAGQPVLDVPYDLLWTGTKAREELGPVDTAEGLLERLQASEDLPKFYLVLKLLKEYERGTDSPWHAWLNALPRYFSNGSSLTHLCSDLLPPLVGNLVSLERVRFRQFFRALKHADCLAEATRSDKQLCKWAFAVVSTRSLPLDDGTGVLDAQLVPVADMFNHGTEAEIELQTDPQTGHCVAITTMDVPAGAPLRVSYGDPTNPSHLFARYGFLDESSPATFCKLLLNSPTKDVIEMGYDPSRMLFYKDTGDVSEEVWDVLLYHRVLGYDGKQGIPPGKERGSDRRALYEAHIGGDAATKQAIHAKYSGETVEALLDHVDTFLGELEQLTEQAAGRDLDTHPRLPLLMRHNAFVRDTFLRVRARLAEY